MSASREKKQRQVSGPSPKDLQDQQKAAAYRRKATRYTIIGVVAALLVAALLTYNSGIFQRGQTAAVVGDTKYSVNDVSYLYQTIRNQSFYIYYALGYTPPTDDTVADAESGQTYRELFMENTLDALKRTTALYDNAIANGYSEADVADTVQTQIDSTKASAASNGYSYGAFLKAQYGRYMTKSDYKRILTKSAVAEAYSSDYSASLSYTDEEITAYYEENKNTLDTFEYSYLYFKPASVPSTDSDGNTIEYTDEKKAELEAAALADAKALADEAVAALAGGASVSDLIEKYELTASGTSADHTTGLGNTVSTIYSETVFGMANGETKLFENGTSGYYVITLHERKLLEDPTADIRHILIRAETAESEDSTAVVAPTDEAWAAAKAKAEEILAEYQAGEQTEEAFAALAEKYSEDTGSNTNGGLYTNVYEGRFVDEFNSWIFDQEHTPGDVSLIKHDDGDSATTSSYWGYHVTYFQTWADPVWKTTSRSSLNSADSEEWVSGLKEGYTAEFTSASHFVTD